MYAGRRGLLFLLLAAAATPAAAQQRAQDDERTTVRGVVVDAVRGDPLPNAMVRLVDSKRGVLTDSLGRFIIADVRLGPELLAVKQYGYAEANAEIEIRRDPPLLRVELDPGPIALEGFDVVADRLEVMQRRLRGRRNATATSVHALDQERLQRSGARDMYDFLMREAMLRPVSCAAEWGTQGTTALGLAGGARQGWSTTGCIARRGGVASPRVYIDEAPAIGGLDQLTMYQPYEFYLVEIYSGGGEIRAYTHNFMERMAGQTMALIPIELWFDR